MANMIKPLPWNSAYWPPEQREEYEERAAIMEYLGGLSRRDAEREARELIRRQYESPHRG